jgi:hypothetical protein
LAASTLPKRTQGNQNDDLLFDAKYLSETEVSGSSTKKSYIGFLISFSLSDIV